MTASAHTLSNETKLSLPLKPPARQRTKASSWHNRNLFLESYNLTGCMAPLVLTDRYSADTTILGDTCVIERTKKLDQSTSPKIFGSTAVPAINVALPKGRILVLDDSLDPTIGADWLFVKCLEPIEDLWASILWVTGTDDQTSVQVQAEPTPSMFAVLEGLEEYSVENWDLEGAEAITPEAIRAAGDILTLISEFSVPPEVAPAADGTVCMEWDTPKGLLWVDVGPDRTASVLRKINGEREEKRFLIDGPEFKGYLRKALGALYPSRTLASHEAVITIA